MLRGALLGITAAVCGIIATLALRFGLGVLFADSRLVQFGPVSLQFPVFVGLRWDATALTFIAGLLLLRLHRGVIETVAIMAALGVIWRMAG
jgi:chromate transporter